MLFKRHALLTGVLIAFLAAAPAALAVHDGWETDLAAALEKSAKTGKPVLADFSGSDWCGWCIKLDKEVFSKKDFQSYAKKNLIPVIIDFPRDKSLVSAEQAQKNRQYAEKYGVKGYPTVLLLESDGSVILRTGYRQGGAKKYAEHLDEAIKARKKVNDYLASENPSFQGAKNLLKRLPEDAAVLRAKVVLAGYPENKIGERARAAYDLVQAGSDPDGKCLAYLKSVAGKDPENYYAKVASEKMQSRLNSAFSKVREAQEQESENGASPEAVARTRRAAESLLAVTEEAEDIFAEGEERQLVFLYRALAYRALDDQNGVDTAWKQAVAVDSKAPVLDKVRSMVKPSAD
jgi:thioredoxin-related protein